MPLVSFAFSFFCVIVLSYFPTSVGVYIGGMLVRLPLRRVTATEFLIGALPALVVVYLLVRDQNWPRLNPMSFGFPCSKFPVFVARVNALAVRRPSSIMLS